jgi:hypothetical protein
MSYSYKECPAWNKFANIKSYEAGGCPHDEECKFSHGWKELDYHPDIYKTRKCNEGKKCQFRFSDCPFWHEKSDRKYK